MWVNCSDDPPSTVSIGIAIVHAVWIEIELKKTLCEQNHLPM